VIIMTKDESIVLRVDQETKKFFKKMADARGMSITKLILRLISDGEKVDRDRHANVRNVVMQLSS
jgi:uncharacterized protein (DUF1778 family)